MAHEMYETQLRQQYKLLGHSGFTTLCHAQDVNTGTKISRELLNGEEEVVKWAKEYNGQGNCFLGRAPRNNDGDVLESHCLSLDIDPIREKGEAATEQQLAEAVEAGRLVISKLNYGVLCTSGNGALVLFPLCEAVPKGKAEAWGRQIEAQSRELLKGRQVNVDSTFDAARMVKALGTISTKGNKALWRHARFVDAPIYAQSRAVSFHSWLSTLPEESQSFILPEISKGELDRSQIDITLANRLKLQGFGPEDAYTALCSYATRPGREDDYKRIIQKVFFNRGDVSDLVSGANSIGGYGKSLELWTPNNGLHEYRNRQQTGEPEFPTGFNTIDRATFGLTRGHLFTVAARTNCGKTTFAISTALNLCRRGKSVLFVSTETQYQEIWDRYFAAATGVSAFKIQNGLLDSDDTEQLSAFTKEFEASHKLTVYDGSRPTLGILRQAIEQAKPDVLIFDYFQHVEARETRELEEFVMSVKDLAKEKQVAVLMCAQLHDRYNPQTHKQYTPTMGDMKNSKVLNDESRVVLLLDWQRDDAQGDGPAAVKVIMGKNKGSKDDVVLKLDRRIPRFEEES